jgi:phosphate:Na+ symporter
MFLFGMKQMSDALRRATGGRLEHILGVLTKTTLMAIILGAAVTCIVQSSSATTVMIVGFINAGLMGLREGIAAIMGTNIGTTITAWLVVLGLSSAKAFSISKFALPMIGVGFLLSTARKRRGWRLAGQVTLGLGLLLFGLDIMKEAMRPLARTQAHVLFARFGDSPLLGVLVGAVVTMIVQSSSATIAVIQVLAHQGIIGLDAAIPLVLGTNIGTTITAQLASIGTNCAARRAARAHLLFNVLGTVWVLPLVYMGIYSGLVTRLVPSATYPHVTKAEIATITDIQIATSHTLFNMVNTIVFIPLLGVLARASVLLSGRPSAHEGEPHYLEPHLLETPGAAMEGARRELIRMLEIARQSVTQARDGFVKTDPGLLHGVAAMEESVDRLQHRITEYLVEISRRNLEPQDAEALPVLVHTVNDIERIGDHAENIVELAELRIEQRLTFSEQAFAELDLMWIQLDEMMSDTLEGLRTNDSIIAKRALKHEERLNYLQETYHQSHAQRLTDGLCQVRAGLVFLELVANYEKIGDHLTNINQAILGSFQLGEPVQEKPGT